MTKKILISIFFLFSFMFGVFSANAETIPTFYSSQNFNDGSVALENITTSGNAVVQDNALYLENSYLSYSFNFSPISFDLEFDFKKTDMGSYSRLLYFSGIDLEIEVKGSSYDLYIKGNYTGTWVMNVYSHFRFSYKNDILEIYLDNNLITSITCSDVITGFQFGKGTSNSNYFNGYIDNLELLYNTYYFSDNFSLNEIPILPVPFDLEHLGDSSYFDELKIKNMNYCILYDSKDNALVNNKLQILCSDKMLMLPVKNSLQRFKSVDLGEFSIVSFHIYDGKWQKGYDKTYTKGDIGDSGLELNGKIYATNYDFKRETEELVYPYYSNRILFPHLSSIVSYNHQESFTTQDVSSFYFNAVNPASDGLFQFKIEFESNNGVFPDYNFKYLTKKMDGTSYYEEDDSISGFGFDYDDCATIANKMTCTGEIDLSRIESSYSNVIYYRWEQDIFNFDELDGIFTVSYNELSNFGFSTVANELKGLNKYILNGSDILVSPNGQFTLYIHSDYFRFMKLYGYDISTQTYEKQILSNSLSNEFYYQIPIDLSDDRYLRILTHLKSYVVYSDTSLVFSNVDKDGNTEIAIPGEPNKSINVGSSILDHDSKNDMFLNDTKNAFSYFKNVFVFIFNVISEFYYSFPVGFRYFVILSFLITIVYIVIKIV